MNPAGGGEAILEWVLRRALNRLVPDLSEPTITIGSKKLSLMRYRAARSSRRAFKLGRRISYYTFHNWQVTRIRLFRGVSVHAAARSPTAPPYPKLTLRRSAPRGQELVRVHGVKYSHGADRGEPPRRPSR